MFNMLFEHCSVCQSLLKEQRRPTGGLMEAFKESVGGRVSTPPPSWVRSKTTTGASITRFPHLRKTIGYCSEWTVPHKGASSGSLFSYCGGDHEGAALIGSKTLSVLGVPF